MQLIQTNQCHYCGRYEKEISEYTEKFICDACDTTVLNKYYSGPGYSEICPVCGTACKGGETTCKSCGFTDRLGIVAPWLDLAEAEDWMNTVVMPYRRYWKLQKSMSTKLKKLERVVDKSFSANKKNLENLLERIDRLEERVGLQKHEISLDVSAAPQIGSREIHHKNMVLIPGGSFMMGSPAFEPGRHHDESPQHEVTISPFYMGIYPVTQAEYAEIMSVNDSNFTGKDLPVETVSWYEAVEYCNWLSLKEGLTIAYEIEEKNVSWNRGATGYRLPTEAEWEYACRAGTTTPYNTGNNITTEQANYNGKIFFNTDATSPVGSFAANPWGLYDMHGNVWEWCWDWFGNYPSAAQTDPVGASSGANRVIRGGSWGNSAQGLRSAYRNSNDPAYRSGHIGFRLARPYFNGSSMATAGELQYAPNKVS